MYRKLEFFKSSRRLFTIITSMSCVLLSACNQTSTESEVKEPTGVTKTEDKDQQTETLLVVPVQKKTLTRKLDLPGELVAYQDVPIHAKVEGYIKWIGIDRGSFVKKGQKLITVFCPELDEKAKEAASKLSSAKSSYRQAQSTEDATRSKLVEAKAKLDADQLTLTRLQQAAQTPGAVAQNEVDLQQKAVESDSARVESVRQEVEGAKNLVAAEHENAEAAKQVLNSLKVMTDYLTIRAPFDGVITERNVHEGSIVAVDSSKAALPMVRIQEEDHLRLVVAVPENSVSGTKIGQRIEFSVPAFIGKTFHGVVARPGHALDNATRTMPVELDVANTDGTLEPGMFATVHWQVIRPYQTFFVPNSAVESDLKGTFVNVITNGVSERVRVQRGLGMDNEVEISGKISEGDMVALKATNELRSGTHVTTHLASAEDLQNAGKKSSAGGE